MGAPGPTKRSASPGPGLTKRLVLEPGRPGSASFPKAFPSEALRSRKGQTKGSASVWEGSKTKALPTKKPQKKNCPNLAEVKRFPPFPLRLERSALLPNRYSPAPGGQKEALRLHRPSLMKHLWVYPSSLEQSASAWEGIETEALRFRHTADGKRFVPRGFSQ